MLARSFRFVLHQGDRRRRRERIILFLCCHGQTNATIYIAKLGDVLFLKSQMVDVEMYSRVKEFVPRLVVEKRSEEELFGLAGFDVETHLAVASTPRLPVKLDPECPVRRLEAVAFAARLVGVDAFSPGGNHGRRKTKLLGGWKQIVEASYRMQLTAGRREQPQTIFLAKLVVEHDGSIQRSPGPRRQFRRVGPQELAPAAPHENPQGQRRVIEEGPPPEPQFGRTLDPDGNALQRGDLVRRDRQLFLAVEGCKLGPEVEEPRLSRGCDGLADVVRHCRAIGSRPRAFVEPVAEGAEARSWRRPPGLAHDLLVALPVDLVLGEVQHSR